MSRSDKSRSKKSRNRTRRSRKSRSSLKRARIILKAVLGSVSCGGGCRFFLRVNLKMKRLKQKQHQMTETYDKQHTTKN